MKDLFRSHLKQRLEKLDRILENHGLDDLSY